MDTDAAGARLLDHLLDRLHDPRPRGGDAASRSLGAVFYLFQDVVVKANLFLGAGAARRLTDSESFARTGGLWRARPWFSLLFLIPALSLAGVPPFAGFWAKLLLAKATLDAGRYWLTFAVLGVGLLTLFAMARVWSEVFWKAHPAGDAAVTAAAAAGRCGRRSSRLTLLVVGVGVDAGPFIDAARTVGAGILDPSALHRGGARDGEAMSRLLRPGTRAPPRARLLPRPGGLEPAGGAHRARRQGRRRSRASSTVPLAMRAARPEITLVANYITLTPGTLTVDVSPDRSTLLVHSLLSGDERGAAVRRRHPATASSRGSLRVTRDDHRDGIRRRPRRSRSRSRR